MKRLLILGLLAAAGCTACGSSMSTAPVLQPGAFVTERTIKDQGRERLGIDFAATSSAEGRRLDR